jgi:hypothetical protein
MEDSITYECPTCRFYSCFWQMMAFQEHSDLSDSLCPQQAALLLLLVPNRIHANPFSM